MPIGNGGKFTPEAREVYKLVLEMQQVHPPFRTFLEHIFICLSSYQCKP